MVTCFGRLPFVQVSFCLKFITCTFLLIEQNLATLRLICDLHSGKEIQDSRFKIQEGLLTNVQEYIHVTAW